MQATLLCHLRRNAVAYLALFVALGGTSFAAATTITGKNVKDSSLTGADVKKGSLTGTDVKNSSLTGADLRSESVNSDDVQNGSLLGQDFAPGQLPQGPQGPKGDTGAKGDKGEPGTDASINGVAAGGDLAGTFPNPSIGDGKVTTAKLAPGTQQATIINVLRGHYFNNDPATIGPFSGPHRFLVDCAGFSTGMRIVLQNNDTSSPGFPPPPNGKHHTVYVRGTNTVKRTDGDLRGLGWTADGNDMVNTAVDTGTIQGNDSGTGSFIAHTPNATVSGTFSYLADDTHCELLASMELMQ